MNEIKKKAEAGQAYAQFEYGQYFEFGKGVEQDFTQAKVWYEKAAEQGFAKAQYNLAMLYQHGRGVQTDYKRALYYYMLLLSKMTHGPSTTSDFYMRKAEVSTRIPRKLFAGTTKPHSLDILKPSITSVLDMQEVKAFVWISLKHTTGFLVHRSDVRHFSWSEHPKS